MSLTKAHAPMPLAKPHTPVPLAKPHAPIMPSTKPHAAVPSAKPHAAPAAEPKVQLHAHAEHNAHALDVPGSTTSWSTAASDVIMAGLNDIPIAGSFLSALVQIFWPSDQTDVWGEIRGQVQQLINQAIADDDYGRVAAQLGDAKENTGLIGVLNNYMQAFKEKQNVESNWTSAKNIFTYASGAFEQQSCAFLLLPLFAQMANLHLTLLRDGVLLGFLTEADFQTQAVLYMNYAQSCANKAPQMADGGAQSNVTRFVQLNVLNFSRLWQYFDPVFCPQKFAIPISPAAYYGARAMGGMEADYLPATDLGDTADISDIDFYVVNYDYDNTVRVIGSNVFYRANEQPVYTGWDAGDGVRPPKEADYGEGFGRVWKTTVNLWSKNRTVQEIDFNYSYDAYIRQLTLKYSDGNSDSVPAQVDGNGGHSNYTLSMSPPDNYFLTSVTFASIGWDAYFGFQTGTRVPVPVITASAWNATVPVSGSTNWIQGNEVQYTNAWVSNDGTLYCPEPWCIPMGGGSGAEPTLDFAVSEFPGMKGRRIWRRFINTSSGSLSVGSVQLVGNIDVGVSSFEDNTP